MNRIRLLGSVVVVMGIAGLIASKEGCAQQVTPAETPATAKAVAPTSASIIAQMQSLSDAQLKALADRKRNPIDWVGGTMWAGVAEFSHISNRTAEGEAIMQMGDKVNWQPKVGTPFHADDDCIGQAFLDAYATRREARTLAPLQTDMDSLAEHLNAPVAEGGKLTWWWCDALFMAPPVLARLSNVTADPKYLDAMNKEWWRVENALYDRKEHLFYRDNRFLPMKTQNGQKVFWSRGNGWVFAGLARILTWMPRDYPDRPKYEQIFKDMAAKLVTLQGSDGMWRTSLLDAREFPQPETSGTSFYCYGMAWGINHGLLPRATYLPAATKAWAGLMAHRRPDGLPGWVQLVGDRPGAATADGTQLYATGGILLAGTELVKLASEGPALPTE